MITAFSMRTNGWVNFKMPNTPTPATIARGRAIAFPADPFGVLVAGEPLAYATKEAAEARDTTKPAIPREWAKVPMLWDGGE